MRKHPVYLAILIAFKQGVFLTTQGDRPTKTRSVHSSILSCLCFTSINNIAHSLASTITSLAELFSIINLRGAVRTHYFTPLTQRFYDSQRPAPQQRSHDRIGPHPGRSSRTAGQCPRSKKWSSASMQMKYKLTWNELISTKCASCASHSDKHC